MHIHEFQDMMHQIYFHHDSKRGVKGTHLWLVEEVEELGEAIKERDKKALENEFADVLAWLASLANVVHINLEEAATAKYNQKCPKCRQMPCRCTGKLARARAERSKIGIVKTRETQNFRLNSSI